MSWDFTILVDRCLAILEDWFILFCRETEYSSSFFGGLVICSSYLFRKLFCSSYLFGRLFCSSCLFGRLAWDFIISVNRSPTILGDELSCLVGRLSIRLAFSEDCFCSFCLYGRLFGLPYLFKKLLWLRYPWKIMLVGMATASIERLVNCLGKIILAWMNACSEWNY